ncbi:MAG: ATPase [Caulobacteraceae bacterium]|nr:ATPase [Caulobacteraceae bacterium]
MTIEIKPAPVRRQITVEATPDRAFTVFTRDFGRWWPKDKSICGGQQKAAVLEPRQGGRWYEIAEDGAEQDWGEVLAWEPPSRLLLAWRIGADFQFDPDLLTEVEVRFIAVGDGATRVELEHRLLENWGERAEQAREAVDSIRGWPDILAAFAAAVAA